MKTRIVMWGTNEKDEKVLIAIALKAEENVVEVFTFPFESTSEEFYNLMLNEWRESHEVSFPEGHTYIARPLTASDSILPPELKVDRPDIIQRAQTEWHFVVLSNKLYQAFLHELEEIKEKIKGTDLYKNQLWEEMKEAWEKIQKNIFDKTLLREHGQQLREMTNDIFTQLKNMRKDMDSELDRVSHQFAESFNTKLDQVEEKIKSGLGLQPLFNDLKNLQQEFKEAQLSRNDRSRIWKRIDMAFKQVKEKKFGEKSSKDTSALDRLNRRYEGLLSAIEKMEKSIRRDDKDKSFQDDRIANTEGQLEAQIRMAKLKMIDERINSKNEKLAEMQKTKLELEERISREKKFLEDQKKQQVLKEELKEAKENVKQKIADNIHTQTDNLDADALGKAAEAIAEQKARKDKSKKKETLLDAISETLGESLEDVGDSIGAIASVMTDKIDDAFKEMKGEAADVLNDVKEDVKGKYEDLKTSFKKTKQADVKSDEQGENKGATNESPGPDETKISDLAADAAGKIEDVFRELKEDAAERIKDAKEEVKETIDDIKNRRKKSKQSESSSFEPQDEQTIKENSERSNLEDIASDIANKLDDAFRELKEDADEMFKDVKEELKGTIDDIRTNLKKSKSSGGVSENESSAPESGPRQEEKSNNPTDNS